MQRTARSKTAFLRLMQRIRVPIGFLMGPLMLLSATPIWNSIAIGGVIAIIGLAIRGWASGHLRKNESLATTGPYAYTRNPLYLGTLVMGTGVAIGAGTFWFTFLFVLLYLLVYTPVMIAEAATMSELFPQGYDQYRENVPLLFPRLTPWEGSKSDPAKEDLKSAFDLSRYLRHREYRAAIGLIVIIGLLVAKLLLLAGRN